MDNIENALGESQENFLSFVSEIEIKRISQVAIRKGMKKYDVKNSKIQNLTPLRVKKIYGSVAAKYSNGSISSKSWLQNQRRLFIWCVVCFLHQTGKQIQQMVQKVIYPQSDHDFEFFQKIFLGKDISLLKFQTFSLIKKNNKGNGWKQKEDETLMKIIESKNNIQWSQVSKQFFQSMGEQFFRNAKQCRQRWLNHLDPNKEKGKWSVEQDRLLLYDVLDKGKKWSQIVPTLSGKKNQHMIKNRFKSLLHKKQKEVGNKNLKETELINLILADIDADKQGKYEKNQDDQEQLSQLESFIENSEEQNDSLKKKTRSKARTYNFGKQKANKEEQQQSGNKKTTCLIVEPKNQFQKEPKREEQIQELMEEKNQEFIERLLHNAPTPMPDNNRFSSIFLEARSPANFLLSPFAPGWTPIFFVDQHQRQASPQVNSGDFGTKFQSDFHKFVSDDTERKE